MVEGGIFTILDNCLQKIEQYNHQNDFEIIALVNDISKFNYPTITFIEFPKSKKYWFYRLYYEYVYFKKLSKKLQPDVWLSLHDVTPNVVAKKQFVYCHNPNMFYKPSLKEWILDYKMGIFGIFYKYLYQINIQKNSNVFVQQHWIKDVFEKTFSIKNIIVSKPEFAEVITTEKVELDASKIHFLFPSAAKYYKNYEIIFEAIEILNKDISNKIQIHFTNIIGSDLQYAKNILRKHQTNPSFNFLPSLERKDLLKYYNSIDCLLFSSKLETWGLPISEAKAYQKPMLVANLAYAKETVGDYDNVSFFDVNNPKQLANLIIQFVEKNNVFEGNKYPYDDKNQCEDWNSIFDIITKN